MEGTFSEEHRNSSRVCYSWELHRWTKKGSSREVIFHFLSGIFSLIELFSLQLISKYWFQRLGLQTNGEWLVEFWMRRYAFAANMAFESDLVLQLCHHVYLFFNIFQRCYSYCHLHRVRKWYVILCFFMIMLEFFPLGFKCNLKELIVCISQSMDLSDISNLTSLLSKSWSISSFFFISFLRWVIGKIVPHIHKWYSAIVYDDTSSARTW